MARTIREIAAEIDSTWSKPYFGAVPYIKAMRSLDTISDSFGYDDGKGIITRFLVNAGTWRGPDARRIKAELKAMLNI
jgi:hypothetical protein